MQATGALIILTECEMQAHVEGRMGACKGFAALVEFLHDVSRTFMYSGPIEPF
jgi:hypothetical protein